ncbi:MAG TPA: EF2563 family selenium-dependent molybdenum hydroxylase system protein [Clostridiales bacterium]|nr:EF2563 family selenium-dependent molybdenum hydroxylase system protein [Clostridiales bacterium]
MENLIIVRGGGDIATGTIHKLHRCGFQVIILEIPKPSAIRRKVAFSEAMYDGEAVVEGVLCRKAGGIQEVWRILEEGDIPVIADEHCNILKHFPPLALVDGILAKKNMGTNKAMAPITVALGPGFEAGVDVDAVIETQRGHDLGRILFTGFAAKNTGVPGIIGGYGRERVIHSPASGTIKNLSHISDTVAKGQVIATVGEARVEATIDGILRGIIKDGYPVEKGLKIADIDPRIEEKKNCFTISDKARCIGGSVLEAILYLQKRKNMKFLAFES